MNKYVISLPMAVSDKEYIIYSVSGNADRTDILKSYGIKPGTMIKLIFSSPSGNPAAYEIMGTVLSLRKETAENILITPVCIRGHR